MNRIYKLHFQLSENFTRFIRSSHNFGLKNHIFRVSSSISSLLGFQLPVSLRESKLS